ncbi:MAG: right-handed parallel beta-helix repeat-containing protein, partial [Clostridia bacterium]|nr:right-handed parallel beta-helix repeat-containing protein [Clostridia bacterium]
FIKAQSSFEYQYVYNPVKPISTYTEKEYPLVKDADIYVSVDGSDKNDGSFEKPIATFERAVEMVRDLKRTAKKEIKVAFMAGNYGYLDLELTEADTGSDKVPITYCAYGNGEVTFSNAVELTLDEFVSINDSEKSLFPEKAASSIKKIDLSSKVYKGDIVTVQDIYGDYYFGKESPYYGQYKGTVTYVAGLYDDEQSLELARFPNKQSPDGDDYFKILGSAESSITILLNQFFKNRFSGYHTYENIQFIGMDQAEYESSFFVIADYDKETGIIKTADSTNGRGVHMAPEGYFQNISKELDTDGEYWIDVENKILYVYAPISPKYYLATEGTLLKVTDADYINFIGLNFKHAMDEGIIVNADHVTISDAQIMGILGSFERDTEFGTHAVILNGNYNTLRDSVLSQLGGGGVSISGGDPDYLIPSGTVVDNNLITRFGLMFPGWTSGVKIFDCVGATVSHNEISYTPHIALHFDRGYEEKEGDIRAIDNIVEFNYIHHVATHYRDIGAIYHGECQTNRGNIIRYNLISNVGAGAWALYLDDGISGQSVYGNTFHNPGGFGILGGAGRDCIVTGNYIIKEGNNPYDTTAMAIGAKYADMLRDDGVERLWTSTWQGTYAQTMNDIPKDPAALKIWQERWPELFEALDERDKITPDRITDRTLMVNSAGCVYKDNFAFGTSRTFDFSFDESSTWF